MYYLDTESIPSTSLQHEVWFIVLRFPVGTERTVAVANSRFLSVWGSIKELLAASTEKRRNFVETVELQIGLKTMTPRGISVSPEL